MDKVRYGLDHLAVNVELKLNARMISDPHRARAGVAFEMLQLFLLAAVAAVDIVEDLQLGAGEPRRMQHPTDERARLVLKSQSKQRTRRKCRVAQPTVPIVPIKIA